MLFFAEQQHRVSMGLVSQGATDAGLVRTQNEDKIAFDDALGLYVVCDGIGGRRRGEVAAEIAKTSIVQYVESSRNPMEVTWPYGYNLQLTLTGNRMLTAAKVANRQVWRRSEESLEFLGMGTTVSAILIDRSEAAVVNVGDSRAYLLRKGELNQLTIDDTIAGTYFSTREFTPDDLRYPQLRNVLTSALGSQENVEVHLKEFHLEDGDRILLCSDGLHGCVPQERIRSSIDSEVQPETAVSELFAAAREAGAPDNISAVLVEYRDSQ
jgi:protein phosphatase